VFADELKPLPDNRRPVLLHQLLQYEREQRRSFVFGDRQYARLNMSFDLLRH
jgi:hypothetical protein